MFLIIRSTEYFYKIQRHKFELENNKKMFLLLLNILIKTKKFKTFQIGELNQ